ncbi:protamine-2 (modular protein) [Taklimakanibacter lacteus]|uniref:protamine-2 (modular protein) n=1 Tax=Taklimakanibacter lacteus TaxID=2268456 RepID=UPI0013C4C7ED
MDRRLFVTGLFGVAGAAALATIVTPRTEALAGVLADETAPGSSVLPNLEDLKADADESGDTTQEAGEQLAWHNGYRHRRRRRRRWRRICRRYWRHGRWRRRCRRRPVWIWLSIG